MSNAEIEDVLSSIRRLVSEDVRTQRVQRLTRIDMPTPARPALVLTPAQRITEEPLSADRPWTSDEIDDVAFEPAAELPELDASDDMFASDAVETTDSRAALERAISELEAAVASIEDEFEPDLGDKVEFGEDRAELDEAFVAEPAADEAEEASDEGEAPSLASFEAATVADVPSGEWPDDQALPPETASEPTQDEQWDSGLDVALTEGVIPGSPDVPAPPETDVPTAEHHGDDDLWLAEAGDDDPFADAQDPDGTPELDATGDASPEAAAPVAGGRLHLSAGEPASEDPAHRGPRIFRPVSVEGEAPEDAPATDDQNLFGEGAEPVLDMDALRDLVAEIIREELQGALGERITRNVRKLVRREISRVLDARGFE